LPPIVHGALGAAASTSPWSATAHRLLLGKRFAPPVRTLPIAPVLASSPTSEGSRRRHLFSPSGTGDAGVWSDGERWGGGSFARPPHSATREAPPLLAVDAYHCLPWKTTWDEILHVTAEQVYVTRRKIWSTCY